MKPVLDALAWIGRYGTQGFALSILAGLALPGLAAGARPLLPLCILLFTTITFARADLGRLHAALRRPRRLLVAALFLWAAPVAMVGGGLALVGRDHLDPGLVLGLAIAAGAPPILSAPGIAMMLGIEPTLLLGATVLTTLASPLLSPIVVEAVAGTAVPLDRWVLVGRLALILGGAVAAAALWRRIVGLERILARGRALDGAGVLAYAAFAIATMDGVPAAAGERPGLCATFLATAFGMALVGLALGFLLLRGSNREDRLIFGYAAGHRNMGLIVVALGASVPDTTFLYFAIAQFPIYLMPQVVRSLAARLKATGRPPPA